MQHLSHRTKTARLYCSSKEKNKTKHNPCCTTCTEMLNYEHQANILARKKNVVEPGNWRGTRHCFTVNSASQSPDDKTTSLTENNKHFLCNIRKHVS